MANAEAIFEDLGVNAVTGVRLVDSLGLTMDQLNMPMRFSKMQHIIKYLNRFGEDTQRFIINKAVRGKNVDKLSHMFEYVILLEDKERDQKNIDELKAELNALEGAPDEMLIGELEGKKKEAEKHLKFVNEEIGIYEK